MEIFLDPNVAYIVLVVGFWLAILAMLAPGTGLYELGALVSLVVAGWAILNSPVNYWALGLLLVGVFPFFLIARMTGKYQYLVISILSLVVGTAFILRGKGILPAENPVLALLASVITATIAWLAMTKVIEAEHATPTHDLAQLIGATGEARTPILETGSVQVGSELWSAWSDQPVPSGAQVRVVARDGFALKVEEIRSL